MIAASLMSAHTTAGVRPRSQVEQTLLAAAIHRMIAQGFCSPDPESLEVVRAAAHDLTGGAARAQLASLQGPLRQVLRAWRATSANELQDEYSRLFVGANLVPLREGSYAGGRRVAGQPVDIADVNGFYLAFGFEIVDRSPFPPDHVGTQMEFMSLLLLKRANAERRGAQREIRGLDQARRLFLNDHLGRWTDPLADALRDAKAAAPYTTLGELLRIVTATQCRDFRIKPQASGRSLIKDDILADQFECPLADRDKSGSFGGPL